VEGFLVTDMLVLPLTQFLTVLIIQCGLVTVPSVFFVNQVTAPKQSL